MSCCNGLLAFFSSPKNHALEREHFERTIAFLGQVPLFKNQMPASELPVVAKHLLRETWEPGSVLVRQGDEGKKFFLIQSGEVRVSTKDDDQVQTERARLYTGDYFGGRTLTTQRPNVATIEASGARTLVTLSMSRLNFEELGLKSKLVFPKRPKIHRNPKKTSGGNGMSNGDLQSSARTQQEQQFILDSVHKNVNLRALLSQADREVTEAMAEKAERREVTKDTVVARCGEFGESFFVIASGSFDVVINTGEAAGKTRSAETAVARSTMAERLQRKQLFLMRLATQKATYSRRASMEPTPVNVDDDEDEEPLTPVTPARPPSRVSRKPRHQSMLGMTPERTSNGGSGDHSDLKVDDHVAFMLPGELQESIGLVQKIFSSGVVEVLFGEEKRHVDADLLRPALAPDTIAKLEKGDSFGELSLIYNVRTEATFKAREDSVVYVIHRKQFKQGFRRQAPRMEEYVALLDEVHMLTPLLNAERWELAQQACGFVEFKPHEQVITQGKPREAKLWYVIHRGIGLMYTNEDSTHKVELGRGGHFGERSLLRGDDAAQVNIDAGPEGMVCLTFHGELIKQLMLNDIIEKDEGEDVFAPLHVSTSAKDWMEAKGTRKNFTEQVDVQLKDLTKVDVLGTGGFADVFLALDRKHDKHYALKRMSMGFLESQGQEATKLVVWERDLMFKVRSPFIVCLYTTFKDHEFIYFLTEALLGGDLFQLVQAYSEIFTEDEPRGYNSAFYVACLIAGLEHMHERCIVHRDLKPENVLIDEKGYAKICDMGFARYVLGKTNTMCGTPDYMPPEQIDFPHAHSHSADWWALGVLTFELLVGQTPWDDEGVIEKRERLLAIRRSQERNELTFPFGCPAGAKGFIVKLLTKLPQRLGADGGAPVVRQNSWFTRLRFDFDALHSQTLPSPFVPPRSDKLERREEVGDTIRESIFERYGDSHPRCRDSKWAQYF